MEEPEAGKTAVLARATEVAGRLASWRDPVLVLGAILYGLGYGTWSLMSWRRGLGVLPALQVQYLVAGFCTGLALVVLLTLPAIMGWLLTFKGLDVFAKWGSRKQRLVVLALAVAPMGVLWLQSAGAVQRPWLRVSTWIAMWVATGLIGALAQVADRAVTRPGDDPSVVFLRKPESPTLGRVSVFAALYWAATLIFLSLGAPYLDWYGALPQELGGGRPRCAFLDIATDSVSLETSTRLGLAWPPVAGTARSKAQRLFFVGTDVILIEGAPPVEMPRSSVRTISWVSLDQCPITEAPRGQVSPPNRPSPSPSS